MVILAERQLLSGLPLPSILTNVFPPPSRPAPTSSTNVIPLSQTSSTSTEPSVSSTISTTPSSLSLSTSETLTSTSIQASSTPIPIIESTPTLNTDPLTVTAVATASPSPSVQSESANTGNGFLQNKVLSGVVFAVVGVVALVILIIIATIAIRRSRRRKLTEEAISFDPNTMGGSLLDRGSVEKRRFSLLSSDHGHGGSNGGHGSGFGAGPAPGSYIPPAPAQVAYPRHDPHRLPPTVDGQYSFGGSSQQPWYGGTNVSDAYGAYLPAVNTGSTSAYRNEWNSSQRPR